jgi:hypothetical protein
MGEICTSFPTIMEKTFVAPLAQDSRVFQPISGLNDSKKQCNFRAFSAKFMIGKYVLEKYVKG